MSQQPTTLSGTVSGPGSSHERLAEVLSGLRHQRGDLTLPQRAELMQLSEPPNLKSFSLFVHRNHAFELIADLVNPFLWFSGRCAKIAYGDYDDSLGFAELDQSAMQLITLDFDRYSMANGTEEFLEWMRKRLRRLRERCTGPILLANWASDSPSAREVNQGLQSLSQDLPGLSIWDIQALRLQMALPFYDHRAAKFKGTQFSDPACILMARDLGLIRLPVALQPRLKAIAVDLDNTLYDGVLGEDGVRGIRITQTHAGIQRELLKLRDEGIFLAVISKNDPQDVDELLASRTDFLLKKSHFSASSISWDSKEEGMKRIGDSLRISLDAILFVDDNPGEIGQVSAALPGLRCFHALSAEHTLFWIRHYPSLHGYPLNATSQFRISDMEAEEQRARIKASAINPKEYLESLQVHVLLAWNPKSQRGRLVEISAKTNQFNTGLQRFTEVEVARRLDSSNCATISFSMRDRLSDSGNIGALFAHVEEDTLVVDEICISCRALGRNIESGIITLALQEATQRFSTPHVMFTFRAGPRNSPARTWLAGYLGVDDIPDGSRVRMAWDGLPSRRAHLTLPISYQWEEQK